MTKSSPFRKKLFSLLFYFFLTVVILFDIILVLYFFTFVPFVKKAEQEIFLSKGDTVFIVNSRMAANSFAKDKKNRVRIGVFGGSQALGVPYVNSIINPLTNFLLSVLHLPQRGGVSTWLEEYLKDKVADKEFEVINLAMVDADLRQAGEIFYKASGLANLDVAVFMSGNNEGEAPFADPGLNVPLGEAKKYIEQTRKDNLTNYKLQVQRIIDFSKEKNIDLYFVTLPSNLRDTKPLARSDSAAPVLYAEAQQLEAKGKLDEAYRLYVKAKDHSLQFLRVRSDINEFLREADGVKVIDLENEMRPFAENSIPGNGLFVDYCHFNIWGNIIAGNIVAKHLLRRYNIILPNLTKQAVQAKIGQFKKSYNEQNFRIVQAIKAWRLDKVGIEYEVGEPSVNLP